MDKESQNTKNERMYGLYIMIGQSANETEIKKIQTGIEGIVEKSGGKIIQSSECVKKELSFPIQKNIYAHITTIYFDIEPESIQKILSSIKGIEGPLIRHILTKEAQIQSEEEIQEVQETQEAQETSDVIEQKKETASKSETQTQPKVSIDDIDKKLDEIMGNI